MKYIALALGLLAGSAATAQTTRFGLKAGVSLATLTDSDTEFTTGVHAGVMFYSPLGNGHFALQPELLYSQKGYHITRATGPLQQGDETLHYFDLPVPVKFRVDGFYLEAGPQFGILMGATATAVDRTGKTASGHNDSFFNAFDIGYALGTGYQSESGLVLGLRYNGGITEALRNTNAHNSVVQLSAGFLFGGGGNGHAREFSQ